MCSLPANMITDPHGVAMNKYNDATRMYPFRLGYGPAASEDYLARLRGSSMYQAQDIADQVRGQGFHSPDLLQMRYERNMKPGGY